MLIKIPFGQRGEETLHISEVVSGLACNCVCLDCGKPLVANKGKVKAHHFAHHAAKHSSNCQGGIETAVHRFAKKVISQAGYLKLPDLVVQLDPPNSDLKEVVYKGEKKLFTRVESEKRLIGSKWVHDLICHHTDGYLVVEVTVTHKTEGKKLDDLTNRKEHVLEIEMDAFDLLDFSAEELTDEILNKSGWKKWLVHPERESGHKKLLEKHASIIQARKIALEEKQKQLDEFNKRSADQYQKTTREIQANRIEVAKQLQTYRDNHRDKTKTEDPIIPLSGFPEEGKLDEIPGKKSKPGFPRRSQLTPEGYVLALKDFFADANYPPNTYSYIYKALIMGGEITRQDIEIAQHLKIPFQEPM